MFETKELLEFQRLRPLDIFLKFMKEQNNGEYSVDRAFSILSFLADSRILFEILNSQVFSAKFQKIGVAENSIF